MPYDAFSISFAENYGVNNCFFNCLVNKMGSETLFIINELFVIAKNLYVVDMQNKHFFSKYSGSAS
jgi:hypothetical protein